MRLRRTAFAVLPLLVVAATACAPEEEPDSAADPTPTSDTSESTDATSETPAETCSVDTLPLLKPGTLTIGTDSPAYEPWFVKNDPTNGKGFESAVAYAVAGELGFTEDQVTWVKVPFNLSFAPGDKEFDFDINQISITEERASVVDFSDGYYQAAQGVVALKDSPVADVSTLAELADYNLGAQTATTSLTAIRDVIRPANDPAVFEDTNAAKQALLNGQIDAILADVPTASYISGFEIPGSTVVGQFQPETGEQEQFGILFEKGSGLVPCVNEAIATLEADGTLEQIEQEWLADYLSIPELQ